MKLSQIEYWIFKMSEEDRKVRQQSRSAYQAEQQGQVSLHLDQLMDCLLKTETAQAIQQARSETDQIIERYRQIESNVMEMVEMRKNMQKIIQVERVQSQHCASIQSLVEQNIKMQQLSSLASEKVKQIQVNCIEKMLSFAKESKTKCRQLSADNLIFTHNEAIRSIADSFFHLSFPYPSLGETQNKAELAGETEEMSELPPRREAEKKIAKEQKQLMRQLNKIKLKDLCLREELICQRQKIFQDYQQSSGELMEVILSKKQRNSNLSRAEKEKQDQLLKLRFSLDVEMEKLTFNQANLIAMYEFSLTALKQNLIKEQQNKQDLKIRVTVLQEQLKNSENNRNQILGENCKLKEQNQQISQAKREIESSKRKLELKLEEVQCSKNHTNQQFTVTKSRLQVLERELKELKEENDRLLLKNECTQTQLNEAILRSSQANKMRQQIAKKLEQQHSQRIHLQNKIHTLIQKNQEEQYNNRVKQSELTQKYDSLKAEHLLQAKLITELQAKRQKTEQQQHSEGMLNKKQNQEESEKIWIQSRLSPTRENDQAQKEIAEQWNGVQEKLARATQYQWRQTFSLIDEFVEKVNKLCVFGL